MGKGHSGGQYQAGVIPAGIPASIITDDRDQVEIRILGRFGELRACALSRMYCRSINVRSHAASMRV